MDPNVISAAQATSVQAALALRQRYEFVWANAAARTAQTGMTTGSTGYQVDTRSEYIYESSLWRLKTPHAEFTASVSAPLSSLVLVGTPTIDSTNSTSTTFATANGNGSVLLASAGLYAATNTLAFPTPSAGTTLFDVATTPTTDVGLIVRVSAATSATFATVTIPNFYVATANTAIYFKVYMNPAQTVTSRIRVTRLS
jgi:hypothetical protein